MTTWIDLNADLGEGGPADDELFALVTSANIACGVHAGDPHTMTRSLALAKAHGVAAGAHPGFADRDTMGRGPQDVTAEEVFALVAHQVGALQALAHAAGVNLRHVKAHGSLYHAAVSSQHMAHAVVAAARAVDPQLLMVGPPASHLQTEAAAAGTAFVAEAFLDRSYQDNGLLVPRTQPDALLAADPVAYATRAVSVALERRLKTRAGTWMPMPAHTLCVHGDTALACAAVRAAKHALREAGVTVRAPQAADLARAID